MTDVRDHLARERRLSRWLARVRAGDEAVECRAIGTESPPKPSPRKGARLNDELRAKSGGEWTRGDRA